MGHYSKRVYHNVMSVVLLMVLLFMAKTMIYDPYLRGSKDNAQNMTASVGNIQK
jgi:hypothetical protein